VLLEAGLVVTPRTSEKQLGQCVCRGVECVGKGFVCMFGIRSRDCNV
jgi:hypothetical protein